MSLKHLKSHFWLKMTRPFRQPFERPLRYASEAPSPSARPSSSQWISSQISGGRTHGYSSSKNSSFAFPPLEVPQIISQRSTRRKSAPFQVRIIIPIQSITNWHSLPPTSFTHLPFSFPYGSPTALRRRQLGLPCSAVLTGWVRACLSAGGITDCVG